jgi:ParB-like chromosome segregation protein Spo0J
MSPVLSTAASTSSAPPPTVAPAPAAVPAKPSPQAHPIAEIFPLMELESPEFTSLVEDIKEHGQREPIVLFEDKILDGRNRARACHQLGREIKTRVLDSKEDPVGFVLSLNLHRRHLNESRRAMVAAKLANVKVGTNQHTKEKGTSIEGAAGLLNVGRASVERALKVLNTAIPELAAAVTRGEVSVSAAADAAKLPTAAQEALAKGKKGGGKATASSPTPFDRLDKAWGKANIETRSAFVEANFPVLQSLVKSVGSKKAG